MVEFAHLTNTLDMELNRRDLTKAFRTVDSGGEGYVTFVDYINTYMNNIINRPLTKTTLLDDFHKCDVARKGHLTQVSRGQY